VSDNIEKAKLELTRTFTKPLLQKQTSIKTPFIDIPVLPLEERSDKVVVATPTDRYSRHLHIAGQLRRARLHMLLSSQRFDTAMGCVIALNSLCIGLRGQVRADGEEHVIFGILEQFFLSIYCIEIGIRFYTYHLACLKSGWVRFDLALVLIGGISTWAVEPYILNQQLEKAITWPTVLKTIRLLRVARAVRLIVQFRTFWMLVQGLLGQLTQFYTPLGF